MENKTIFYARVSTLKDEQESSIPHQISQLESFAKINGLNPIDIIIDKISASKTTLQDRLGTKKLIELANNKEFDVLLAKSVSRIGRDTIENLTLKRILEMNGIKIIAIQEGLDTTKDDDEFLYTLHSSLAQSYSKKLGKDVTAGQIEKAKKGGWNFPWTPFGYEWDGQKLIKNDNEKYTTEKIFNYLKEGIGYRKISRLINECEECIKPRISNMWSPNTISQMSKNRVYYGAIIYKKEVITEIGLHDPYISKKDFELIQSYKSSIMPKNAYTPTALLSGVAKCGYCNGSVFMLKRYNKNSSYRYYSCNTQSKKGINVCKGIYRREEEINQYILKWLDQYIFSQTNEIEKYLNKKVNEIESNDLEKQIAEIDKRIEYNTSFYLKQTELLIEDKISEDLYHKALEKIKNTESSLKEKKKELLSKQSPKLDIENIKNIIKTGQSFYKWDLDEQRLFLKRFIIVNLYRDKIKIEIKESP